MTATSAFIGAFREDSVTSSLANSDEFDEYDARRLRYAMYAASYENTSYRNIHKWAQGKRNRYGLGKYIRDIHNPTAQLVDFHTSTVWRGSIAPLLQGGAIPLVVNGGNEDAVRKAADNLLRLSNFETGKNITVMKGSNLGDVGLKIVDDIERGQSRIEIVDPSDIEDIVVENGIIKAYSLSKWQNNDHGQLTKYTETCERGDGEDVIFRHYVNDRLGLWPEEDGDPEWVEVYGFIPFVTIQHRNVGRLWGWAEAHPVNGKIMEMDDIASMLDDYIRKTVNAPALMSGMSKPNSKLTTTTSAATSDNPEPGREESKLLWAGDGVNATYAPMIAGMSIAEVDARLQTIMASIESDMPELRKSIWDIGGDPSGVALATAREPTETKINGRRTNYDGGLVRAIQMGIAIGGMRGYAGFEGFDLGSYQRGDLDISIASRPVFSEQKAEKIANNNSFWTTWAGVSASGSVPFEAFARSYGWTDEQLKEFGTQKAADTLLQQEDVIPTETL
jgi:hypothetical protein